MKHLLLFVLLVGCAMAPKKELFTLRVLHTNDHHGHYLPDSKGQYGMAPRKTLIDELKRSILQEDGFSLLLSGGDINTGTMESDMFDAKPDFLGMKYIGYDAMAVGNHEFDNDFKVIQEQQKWAGFPFLAANIFYKGTDKLAFETEYIIREYKGFKIGIFGLTTKDTPYKASNQKAREQFDFKDIVETSKKVVAKLRPQVDMIIAVTHVGHHGSLTANGDIDLAKKVQGIDIIVGGHSQEVINAEVHNNTVIIQAEDWGKYVGALDVKVFADKSFMISTDGGFEYKLHPVNHMHKVSGQYVYKGKKYESDKVLDKLFLTYKLDADRLGSKKIGTSDKGLNGERKMVRLQQMPIGQFFGAAVMLKEKDVDAVLLNGGSIRSSLEPGDITWKDLHRLHPYGNTICTVVLSTQEFYDYVNKVASDNVFQTVMQGSYPQIVNMQLIFNGKDLVEIKSKNWNIKKVDGKIVGSKDSYKLGTMNFLATGGDNYPKITDHKTFNDSGFMINAAMKELVEKKKRIKASEFEKLSKNRIIKK